MFVLFVYFVDQYEARRDYKSRPAACSSRGGFQTRPTNYKATKAGLEPAPTNIVRLAGSQAPAWEPVLASSCLTVFREA